MPIVQVAPVTRQGMKLLISLFGLSETGKTLTALKLMAGIEPDPRKRGLLDSEGGNRGRMYFDAIEGGYMYGALSPPFTPERYAEGLRDFVEAGVTTLTIDSVSHGWTAAGGVLDMVEQATERNDMAKWAKPKRRLGKFTGQLLTCDLHLILCSRAKQPYVEEIVNGKKTYVPGPITPIQEKSLRYDMTIMALMLGDGRFTTAREYGGKCPGVLRPIFDGHEVMNEDMGKQLIAWIGGQDIAAAGDRVLQMDADEAASHGTESYVSFWQKLTREQRAILLPRHEDRKSIAKTADDEAARAKEDAEDGDRADPFGAGKALETGISLVGGTDVGDEQTDAAAD